MLSSASPSTPLAPRALFPAADGSSASGSGKRPFSARTYSPGASPWSGPPEGAAPEGTPNGTFLQHFAVCRSQTFLPPLLTFVDSPHGPPRKRNRGGAAAPTDGGTEAASDAHHPF